MRITFAILAFLSSTCLATTQTTPCVNYDKPHVVHPGHYWDGRIHLVPTYAEDGKTFVGYVIVRMPKESPFWKRGFQVGDTLIEIDGVRLLAPRPGVEADFSKIKANSFKAAKLERCQSIRLAY